MTLRMFLKFAPVVCAVLTAGFAMRASALPIVADGGFETPAVGPYTGSLGDGWTATAGTIPVFNVATGLGVPHTGSQMLYLDFGSSVNTVSQTLTTTIGQSYLISYWVADTNANSLSSSFGGVTLFSGLAPTNGVGSAGNYVNYQFTQTASSTSTVLSFTGQYLVSGQGNGTLLDDVSVTASSVPEPATFGFVGLGCAALLALRRKLA